MQQFLIKFIESGVRFLVRFLIKVMVILLSIWTILALLLWMNYSAAQGLGGQSASLADTVKFFAIPAVGWILVFAALVKTEQTEQPWRKGYFSDDDEEGVWVGSIYLPNRADKDPNGADTD
jgi:hypothetical protein